MDVANLLKEIAEKNQNNPLFQAMETYKESMQPGAIGMTKAALREAILKRLPLGKKPTRDALSVVEKWPRAVQKQVDLLDIEGSPIGGAYTFHRPANAGQTVSDFIFLLKGKGKNAASVAEGLAHEGGHVAENRILQRLKNPELSQDVSEAIAHYLGGHLQQKAGLSQINLSAMNEPQFKIIKELANEARVNPYMDVYRYLQKVLSK